ITVTVAGVSRGVSPSRLTLFATVPVLSGEAVLAGWVGGAAGAGARAPWSDGFVDGLARVDRGRGGGDVPRTGGSGGAAALGGGGAVCARTGSGRPSQMMDRSASARDGARGETADARRPTRR